MNVQTLVALTVVGGLLTVSVAAYAAWRHGRLPVREPAPLPIDDPLRGMSVLVAAAVAPNSRAARPAEILALAVDGRVRLVDFVDAAGEHRFTAVLRERPQFRRARTLAEQYHDAMTLALFGGEASRGASVHLHLGGTSWHRMTDVVMQAFSGPEVRDSALPRRLATTLATSVVLLALLTGAAATAIGAGIVWVLLLLPVSLTLYLCAWPGLSDQGKKLRELLSQLGQRTDALIKTSARSLASVVPAGDGLDAEIAAVEALLPWAALCHRERDVALRIGRLHEIRGTEPEWYSGATPFDAQAFARSVQALTWDLTVRDAVDAGGGGGG